MHPPPARLGCIPRLPSAPLPPHSAPRRVPRPVMQSRPPPSSDASSASPLDVKPPQRRQAHARGRRSPERVPSTCQVHRRSDSSPPLPPPPDIDARAPCCRHMGEACALRI
ncbi:hypothetical protein HYPSUDRAFT_40646 [Hypholoma sublateritium FD-334 SS-4]|uniref:Uncharacterized protein n=1 Tax=Hypholoma sublateritium (strain FD-334 SS-4) TaxID=945553 RepID=A0A0D2P2A5_HYPSF|nr:hypothetical protein HYPSUDRAFT_50076 [Hypholoma sublateritium FD-334 SS-4]KJA22856.1 hypothetical protein HYPSUDRAFT_40646 [Hypholoma sublateritium FD-334 SS-4]